MTNIEDYQINYWPTENNLSANQPKRRSVKRRLAIVASFLLVLSITPSIVFGLANFDLKPAPKVSVVNDATNFPAETETPTTHKVTIEEPKKSNLVTIINNDSYWKISKRACGTGKFYLSIQAQNDGKALYKGETAVANCNL